MHTKQDNRFLGNYGEKAALTYLRSIGVQIVETNYTLRRQRKNKSCNFNADSKGCILGEIDVIAREKDFLIFIEVKWRSNDRFGRPVEAVTPTKQKRLRRLGEAYIAIEKPNFKKVRFDVIGIIGFPPYLQIEHIRNAF